MAEAPAPTHKRDVAEVGIGDEVAPAAKQRKLENEQGEDNEDSDEDNDVDNDDWKATLFYWRGLLTHEPGSSTLSWEGAWVGSASGMPSDADFEASENTFAQTGAMPKKVAAAATLSALGSELEPAEEGVTAKMKGTYLLDQGDGAGPQTYSDINQTILIHRRDEQNVHVAAKGNTEFGRFISAGRLDAAVGDGNRLRLTLVRRYLDGDPREKWPLVKVAEELGADAREAATAGPWRAKAMRLRLS